MFLLQKNKQRTVFRIKGITRIPHYHTAQCMPNTAENKFFTYHDTSFTYHDKIYFHLIVTQVEHAFYTPAPLCTVWKRLVSGHT